MSNPIGDIKEKEKVSQEVIDIFNESDKSNKNVTNELNSNEECNRRIQSLSKHVIKLCEDAGNNKEQTIQSTSNNLHFEHKDKSVIPQNISSANANDDDLHVKNMILQTVEPCCLMSSNLSRTCHQNGDVLGESIDFCGEMFKIGQCTLFSEDDGVMFEMEQSNLFTDDDGEMFQIGQYNLFSEGYQRIKNEEYINNTRNILIKLESQTSELLPQNMASSESAGFCGEIFKIGQCNLFSEDDGEMFQIEQCNLFSDDGEMFQIGQCNLFSDDREIFQIEQCNLFSDDGGMFQIGQCNLFSEDDGEVFEIKEYNLFRENYDKIKNKELIRYTFSKIKTQTSELNENPHPFEVDALLDKSILNIKKNRLTFNLPLNISIADVFEEYDNLNTEERNSVQNIPLILEENGEILLLDILTRTDIDLIDNYDRLSSHQREFLKNIIEILNPHKKFLELLVLISNVNIYNIFIEYDKLSNDQSPVFKNIIKSLGGNSENVLRLFVGGEPGTGKSYLIKILKLWVEDILGNKVAISAPTKTGAMCIKGDTIHKLFRLPVDNDNKPSYKPLTSTELSILRRELNDVILFIIDDIYLVSSDLLGCIHIRLTEIYGTKGHSNGWFGGKHILLLGDLFLHDAVAFFPPVFCKINDPFIQKQVYETIFLTVRPNFEFNIWDLFEYDELTYNMRQEKDQNYLDLLRRLRSKTYDVKADTQIETREITANKFECDINQLYLFERPGDCNRFNHYMLSLKSNCKIKLQAIDEIVYSENYVHPCMIPEKVNYYFHLDENIIIANGSRVMLTADVGDFAAGSIANVICVHLPDAPKLQFVTVEFDNNKRVNIYRITSQYEASDGIFYTRLQFPFILAFALTILDSLGLQLNKVCLDGTSITNVASLYAVLTRLKSLDEVSIIVPYKFMLKPNICETYSPITEYQKLQANYRPDLVFPWRKSLYAYILRHRKNKKAHC